MPRSLAGCDTDRFRTWPERAAAFRRIPRRPEWPTLGREADDGSFWRLLVGQASASRPEALDQLSPFPLVRFRPHFLVNTGRRGRC